MRIGTSVKNRGGAIALASTALLLLTLTPMLPTMAAEAASSDSLVYSTSAGRTSPQKLFGASVQGDIYVAWTGPVSGSVYFALDPIIVDGGIKSASYDHTERFRPYDLAGTRSSGAAAAFHTRDLSDGSHRLALLVGRDGTSPELQVVSFEVRNSMATAPAPGAPPRTTMVSADFDDQAVGPVSPKSFNEQVGPSNGDTGAYQGMTYAADTRGSGKVIRTYLAANKDIDSSGEGRGNVLMVKLPGSYDSACAAYDLRFSDGFGFSAGGKLPGLLGVAPGTPPSTPEGGGSTEHGWSGRLMWLGPTAYRFAGEGGNSNMAVTYLYHARQTGIWGDNIQWHRPFVADRWHHVEQCFIMNTPGQADGKLEAWIDGQMVVDRSDVLYRDDPAVHITHFDWSVFRGGGSSLWASPTDGYVDIDNLHLSRS